MKETRWMLLIVILFCIFITNMYAQKPVGKTLEERSALTLERYKNDITLTDQQKVKILSLAKVVVQKCDSINLLDSLTLKDRLARKKAANIELNNQILNNLSASQKEQLRIKQAARDNAREGKK